MAEDKDKFVLEEVQVEEDDSNIQFEEVIASSSDEEEEDLKNVLKTWKNRSTSAPANTVVESKNTKTAVRERAPAVDDFIRNFFVQHKMQKSLDVFQSEWFEMKQQGKLQFDDNNNSSSNNIDDVYLHNQWLQQQVSQLQQEVEKAQQMAEKAAKQWEKFRQERDHHRLHHRRVAQEKNRLLSDLKKLKLHYEGYEPVLLALKQKYEQASREKMVAKLEKDKLKQQVEQLTNQLKQFESLGASSSSPSSPTSTQQSPQKLASFSSSAIEREQKESSISNNNKTKKTAKLDSFLPVEPENPYKSQQLSSCLNNLNRFALRKHHTNLHKNAVTSVCLHPTKPLFLSASDDATWKLSTLKGELLMAGVGHKDWISWAEFHPSGKLVATSSGDQTVKLWSLTANATSSLSSTSILPSIYNKESSNNSNSGVGCVATYADHTASVWDVSFHWSGDFLASASQDHTIKLFDLNSSRCRLTLRGHVDAVNSVAFLPYSNSLVTGSGDKCVSLWDCNSGLCALTLFGHSNAVLSVRPSLKANELISCDAEGTVKLWDLRMLCERLTLYSNNNNNNNAAASPSVKLYAPANDVCFDSAASTLFVASEKGAVYTYNALDGNLIQIFDCQGSAVSSLAIDPQSNFVVAGCEDSSARIFGTNI